MERDAYDLVAEHGLKISTHTLTWSVTLSVQRWSVYRVISTHTLTWSVTITWEIQ